MLQLFGNYDQCILLKGCSFFSELKKGLYVQNHCVVVLGFFMFSTMSASLINDHVSFSKPCFCFLGGSLHEWSMTGRQFSSHLIWEKAKSVTEQRPLLGGLHQKCQAAPQGQVCISSIPVSSSYTLLSATLAQLTAW